MHQSSNKTCLMTKNSDRPTFLWQPFQPRSHWYEWYCGCVNHTHQSHQWGIDSTIYKYQHAASLLACDPENIQNLATDLISCLNQGQFKEPACAWRQHWSRLIIIMKTFLEHRINLFADEPDHFICPPLPEVWRSKSQSLFPEISCSSEPYSCFF